MIIVRKFVPDPAIVYLKLILIKTDRSLIMYFKYYVLRICNPSRYSSETEAAEVSFNGLKQKNNTIMLKNKRYSTVRMTYIVSRTIQAVTKVILRR